MKKSALCLIKSFVCSTITVVMIGSSCFADSKTAGLKACNAALDFTRTPEVLNGICTVAGLISASFDAQFGDKNTDLVATCASDRNDCAKSAIKQLPVRCTARLRKDFDKSIASCPADKTLAALSACLREAKAAMKSPSFPACKDAKNIIASKRKISVPTTTTPACKTLSTTCPGLFKKINS